jgi:osmotically-inducible protein OsmY
MIKQFNRLSLGAVLLSACMVAPTPMLAAQNAQQTAPDNTGTNKRDQNTSAPTADQAKNDKTDRELARKIRRDVVKDKSLSTYGHNVKIIAEGGKVTLKGPIHSEDERKAILSVAQKYAGDGNVVDQLTVKGDNQ